MTIYYKYRAFSELSIKELLYSELYFATRQENNDPFESKTFYKFASNQSYWLNLIKIISSKFVGFTDNDLLSIATKLSARCPMSYEQVSSLDITQIVFDSIEIKDFLKSALFAQQFKNTIDLYAPEESYFSCFSKVVDEPLMWSHYAANHQGFCLIFKPINGQLNQHPIHRRTEIRRKTPNGLGPSMGMGLPESFRFHEVEYQDNVEHLCAFCLLPIGVTKLNLTEEEIIALNSKQSSQYIQKHRSWKYEQEVRLYFTPYSSYLFGQKIGLTKQERLFNYDPSQLVGIVFGAQMSVENKQRLREVINEVLHRREFQKQNKRVLFDFMVFQAELSSQQRNLDIKPVELLTSAFNYTPDSPEFERMYSDWKKGIGLEVSGNSASKVTIAS